MTNKQRALKSVVKFWAYSVLVIIWLFGGLFILNTDGFVGFVILIAPLYAILSRFVYLDSLDDLNK